MKPEELFFVMQDIDDEYVTEAAPKDKAAVKRKRFIKRMSWIAACLALFFVNLWLFIPLAPPSPPDISAYEGSPYYDLIEKLNSAPRNALHYKNNFARIWSDIVVGHVLTPPSLPPAETVLDGGEFITEKSESGVTEPCSIKVIGDKIYYTSNPIGVLDVNEEIPKYSSTFFDGCEMYIFDDGHYIAIHNEYVWVIGGNIYSDKITSESENRIVSNEVISSGVIGDNLVLVTRDYAPFNGDFSKESRFIPKLDNGSGLNDHELIIPDEITERWFVTVTLFDSRTLEQKSAVTIYSISELFAVYISEDAVFISSAEYDTVSSKLTKYTKDGFTDIHRVCIEDESLDYGGKITVEGFVENECFMDEKDGILRVVAENRSLIYKRGIVKDELSDSIYGASIYLISLENEMSVINDSAQWFGWRKSVHSVGFDGDIAYVGLADQDKQRSMKILYKVDFRNVKYVKYTTTTSIQGEGEFIDFGDYFINLRAPMIYYEGVIGVYKKRGDSLDIESSYTYTDNTAEQYYGDYPIFLDREKMLIGYSIKMMKEGGDHSTSYYVMLKIENGVSREIARIPFEAGGMPMDIAYVDGWVYIFTASEITRAWIGEY